MTPRAARSGAAVPARQSQVRPADGLVLLGTTAKPLAPAQEHYERRIACAGRCAALVTHLIKPV